MSTGGTGTKAHLLAVRGVQHRWWSKMYQKTHRHADVHYDQGTVCVWLRKKKRLILKKKKKRPRVLRHFQDLLISICCVVSQATARSAPDREREINNLVRKADFNNDRYLQTFGISIQNQMTEVQGRVLPAPKLQYGGRVSANPNRNRVTILTSCSLPICVDGSTDKSFVCLADQSAGCTKPGSVGYARQTAVPRNPDQGVGHRMLRSAEKHHGRGPQVNTTDSWKYARLCCWCRGEICFWCRQCAAKTEIDNRVKHLYTQNICWTLPLPAWSFEMNIHCMDACFRTTPLWQQKPFPICRLRAKKSSRLCYGQVYAKIINIISSLLWSANSHKELWCEFMGESSFELIRRQRCRLWLVLQPKQGSMLQLTQ